MGLGRSRASAAAAPPTASQQMPPTADPAPRRAVVATAPTLERLWSLGDIAAEQCPRLYLGGAVSRSSVRVFLAHRCKDDSLVVFQAEQASRAHRARSFQLLALVLGNQTQMRQRKASEIDSAFTHT